VAPYAENVFLNHPLDTEFHPIRDALIFAVHDCGFVTRAALEASDASENRLEKIYRIIEDCRFGIHDISRTELNENGLPRFNMPFELGLFLGCKRFGSGVQQQKSCLVLDSEPYRWQQFLSDLSGADIESHDNSPSTAITRVRNWLQAGTARKDIPSAKSIRDRYVRFQGDLPQILRDADTHEPDTTFLDFAGFVTEWLRVNAR
jgi:hypothetical protein